MVRFKPQTSYNGFYKFQCQVGMAAMPPPGPLTRQFLTLGGSLPARVKVTTWGVPPTEALCTLFYFGGMPCSRCFPFQVDGFNAGMKGTIMVAREAGVVGNACCCSTRARDLRAPPDRSEEPALHSTIAGKVEPARNATNVQARLPRDELLHDTAPHF